MAHSPPYARMAKVREIGGGPGRAIQRPEDLPGTRFLLILLAITTVRGLLYAVLNPPLGSPDEGGHFEYIASLATGGASGPRGVEGHQPVGYYALMVPAYWLTAGQAVAIQGLAIRLLSLSMLLGQIAFAWLAARKLAPDRPDVAVIATCFIAFLPTNTVIGASANNDNAANLVAAALVYLLISIVLERRWWHVPVTITAMGLGVLTKGQLLPLIALSGLIVIALLLKSALGGGSRRQTLWALALPLAGIPILAHEGPVLIQRSQWVLNTFSRWPVATAAAAEWGNLPFVFQFYTFFAAFLAEVVRPGTLWYLLPSSVVAISIAGLPVGLVSLLRSEIAERWRRLAVWAFLLVVIGIQWAVVYLIFLQHVASDFPWRLSYMQGRYLFPLLLPLALLVGRGWSSLAGTLRLPAWYPVPLIAGLALFDSVAMASLVQSYSWQ